MQKKNLLATFLAFGIPALVNAQVTSVNSGNGITVNNANAAAPILNLGGTLNSNVSFDLGASYTFGLQKGSSNYLTLLNNGNVGIGTSTPGFVLDVNGATNIRSTFTINNPTFGGGLTVYHTAANTIQMGTPVAYMTFGPGNYISTNVTVVTPAIQGFNGKNLSFYGNLNAGLGNLSSSNYVYAFGVANNFINNNQINGDFIGVYPTITSGASGSYNHTIIDVNPTINVNGSYASTIRGIYYNPTITSLTGNNPVHIAFQNTVGNNIFNSTSGNTLVGTTTDGGQKFQVAGSTYINGPVKVNVTGLTGMGTATNVLVADANGNLGYTAMTNVGGSGSSIWAPITTGSNSQYNTNTGNIVIGATTDNGSKLQVTGTGYFSSNLVIGVTPGGSNTSPYMLAVNGSAICNKMVVKATASWPDYVFATNYTLQPLSELESYILRNKHLPDVPAASEVEKNGVNIGENQAILLKKIEELTLYVIDQNKAIQELKDKNQKLEAENSSITDLQQQLNELKKMILSK